MSWRGVNSGYALRHAHPETPAHPVLLGKPERDFKVNIKSKIRNKPIACCRSAVPGAID